LPDGGWNCRAPRGDTHSSFHTTILALEGLLEYHRMRGSSEACAAAARGREFLLAHRLFRSHRTGKVAGPEFTRFSFPPHWHYDALRGLEYFRESTSAWDARLDDAMKLLENRRGPDGRWPLQHAYSGKRFFAIETVGAPSRWATLRALRVLQWRSEKAGTAAG